MLVKDKWFSIAVLVWAIINSLIRTYIGVHFLGDIIVGAIVGCLLGSFTYWIYNLVTRNDRDRWSGEVGIVDAKGGEVVNITNSGAFDALPKWSGNGEFISWISGSDLYAFFRNHKVADGETSFTTTFASSYNTYTFENVARLIAALHRKKTETMRTEGLSSAQYVEKYPDWNKVVLVPVSYDSNTSTSVDHDMSLTSVRLVGGTENPNDPIIWSEIIQRAKNWLNEVLPMIFEKARRKVEMEAKPLFSAT